MLIKSSPSLVLRSSTASVSSAKDRLLASSKSFTSEFFKLGSKVLSPTAAAKEAAKTENRKSTVSVGGVEVLLLHSSYLPALTDSSSAALARLPAILVFFSCGVEGKADVRTSNVHFISGPLCSEPE